MKRKQGFRYLAFILAAFMLLSLIPFEATQAAVKKSGKGIAGNGTWGIKIDIYSSPFTDYANPNYKYAVGAADYAYSSEGCAWFAASRVKQITGKDCYISGGPNWYNERYSWYGFARGQKMPTGKTLACYGHHVSVIEAVQDGKYLVSEGGFSGGGRYAENDYCVMHLKTAAQILNESTFGDFIGFVYLTDDAPVFRTDKTPESPKLLLEANGVRLNLSKFNMATGHYIYRRESSSDTWVKLGKTKKDTFLDVTAESGKKYFYTIRAYYLEDGTKYWSKYDNTGVSCAFLAAPVTVKAQAYDGKNAVAFSEVPGAKGYVLFRKEAGGTYQTLATLDANTRKYTDISVKSAVFYVYLVRPFAKIEGTAVKGIGTESAEVQSFKTPLPPKMTAIYQTTSPENDALSATIWFLGNGSDDYTVYRRVKGSSAWKKVKTVAGSNVSRQSGSLLFYSVKDQKVKKGKTYEYTVGCHRTIGTHDLNSEYGKTKRFLFIAEPSLFRFLSDFQSYGNVADSTTREYRFQSRSSQQRLLKALYTDPSVYDITYTAPGARKVITGGAADPYQKFKNTSYVRVKEKALRWAATQIFHCSEAAENSIRSALLNNRKAGKPYIDGAYFYTRNASGKTARTSPRIVSVQKRNGYYYVLYNIANTDGNGGIKASQCAVLKKVLYKGKPCWTLYTHNAGRFLNP